MKTKTVVVKITFTSNSTRLKLNAEAAEKLKDKIKSSKDQWIEFETERGGTCTLKTAEIIGVEIEPYVGVASKREGVTLREVCEVAGYSYSTWVKKVNDSDRSDPIMLDMVSDRKIRTSSENFDKLRLSEKHRQILWKKERERLDNQD